MLVVTCNLRLLLLCCCKPVIRIQGKLQLHTLLTFVCKVGYISFFHILTCYLCTYRLFHLIAAELYPINQYNQIGRKSLHFLLHTIQISSFHFGLTTDVVYGVVVFLLSTVTSHYHKSSRSEDVEVYEQQKVIENRIDFIKVIRF